MYEVVAWAKRVPSRLSRNPFPSEQLPRTFWYATSLYLSWRPSSEELCILLYKQQLHCRFVTQEKVTTFTPRVVGVVKLQQVAFYEQQHYAE